MLPYSAFSRAKAFIKTDKTNHQLVPRRVYGVLGDAFLQKRVLDSLLAWTLSEDARDFNFDILDGEGCTVTDVFARAGNLPFLSEHRAVVVQRAERLEGMHRSAEEVENKAAPKTSDKTGKTSDKRQSAARRLADGLETLPETTVLILARTPETPEPGARASTPRCVNATVDKVIERHEQRHGLIINCTVGAKDVAMANAIVNHEAQQAGIPLSPDAASHLVARAGHDIAHLLNELEKCALRAGPGEVVTPAIIDEMTRRKPQETIFDLTDALGTRHIPRALGLLRELLESGDAPELILAMLVRHLRQLLQARALVDAGLPLDASTLKRLPANLAEQLPRDGRENLATLLQSQSWLGKRLAQQARNFTTAQLQNALQAALATDLAMKGIEGEGGTPELLLEVLVTRLG